MGTSICHGVYFVEYFRIHILELLLDMHRLSIRRPIKHMDGGMAYLYYHISKNTSVIVSNIDV